MTERRRAEDRGPGFGEAAARLSWVCVVLTVVAGAVTKSNPQASGLIAGGLVLVGAVSGVAALVSIPWCGVRRVLLPALCGLLPIALILAVAVPNFRAAWNATRVTLEVPAEQMRTGGALEIEVAGEAIDLAIPPGSREGQQLRVPRADGGQLVVTLQRAQR